MQQANSRKLGKFADIRAYPEILFMKHWRELKNDPGFLRIMGELSKNQKWIKEQLFRLRSRPQYRQILYQLIGHLLDKTTDGFTWEGAEHLRDLPKKKDGTMGAIFISSHRSTSLDPILFNYMFFEETGITAYNAVGDNLLTPQWLGHLLRLNGGFIVKRQVQGEDIDAKLNEARKLSCYITDKLLRKSKHVWIAQRSGRAKDGNDKTESAVLTMLKLAHPGKSWQELCEEIPIIPVSMSYEEIPVDTVIAQEHIGELKKHPGSDIKQVQHEMTQKKRRIHIHVSPRVTATKRNDLVRQLDESIIQGTKIWDSNREAYNLLSGTESTNLEDSNTVSWLRERINTQKPQLRKALISLYATPLVNLYRLKKSVS